MEIHDLASLAPLQTFDLSGATCMTTCPVGGGRGDLTYVATANSVNLLKLIPIEFQVPRRCVEIRRGLFVTQMFRASFERTCFCRRICLVCFSNPRTTLLFRAVVLFSFQRQAFFGSFL